MTKVVAPLLSLQARGQIGKSLIFRQYKTKAIVGKYSKPGDVKSFKRSAIQIEIRSFYYDCVDEWRKLSEEEKGLYNQRAEQRKKPMSGWNLFYKIKFKEWWDGREEGGS